MKEISYPFCSVLVLNWNGKKYLKKCFQSLKGLNYPKDRYEVIMIDNNSTDGSVRFVKKHFPNVKIVQLDDNYGFGGGYNRGLKAAKGKYLLILNNDTHVDKDWLIELVKVAEDKRVGICGSKISDRILGDVGEGHLNVLGIPSQKDNTKATECFWVSDCSILIKKELVRKMGEVYDPSYFLYFDDVDLCWRARLLGYKVIYVPRSIVHHVGAATSSRGGNINKFYHYRNKIWTFKKNSRFPLTQLFMLPIAVSTLVMISYWAARNKWGYGTGVLKYMFLKKEKTPNINRISLKDQLRLFER